MKSFMLFFLASICCSGFIRAQIGNMEKDAIIDSLCSKLEQYYIYPEKANKAIQFIQNKRAIGRYNAISDEYTFASQITADLREAGDDEHLRLEYSSTPIADQNDNPYQLTEKEEEEMRSFVIQQNFGIRKIDILKGNIGFIDFGAIFGADVAGEKYTSIMTYLSDTDALIVDLRNCRGAMGLDGISFLASYFFKGSVHLNDLVWRKNNSVEQKWTFAYVPGKRYLNKPIYILTSARTFSGGEGFSYHLQALKRATIIGEQTRGGANPGASIKLNDHFSVFTPNGTTINPITSSNWESNGVIPDVPVKANMALYEAYKLTLKDCIELVKEERQKQYLLDILEFTEKFPPRFKTEEFELIGYEKANEVFLTGTFNNWARKTIPMKKKGKKWVAIVECEPGIVEYRFIVDEIPILDPNKKVLRGLEYTNSVKVIE
jgi:hypothetical protein